MDADGALGPVLVELKLPGLTDNFEGIAAGLRRVAGQVPAVALVDEIEAGHVRALVVTGGNPPREWYHSSDHYRSFRRFDVGAGP